MSSRLVDRDLGFSDLFKRINEIKRSSVKVGVIADTEKGGLHEPGSDLTVAEIAAVNEFGTEDKKIPERSFARSTFDEKREELAALGKRLMGAVLDGKMDITRALNVMGSTLATAMKNKITQGEPIPPPNAPEVAARKQAKGAGVIRTLVDTGRMVGAITWAVLVGE